MRSAFFSVLLKTETRERIESEREREMNVCVGERKEVGRVFKSNTAPLLGSGTFAALPIFP